MPDILSVDAATIDHSVVYLGLIISLWIGVTSAYVPGTGILEGLAIVGLGAMLMVMVQIDQVRWPAVLVLVMGVSAFFVIPFIDIKYAPYAIGGLGLQAAGAAFMFAGEMVQPFLIVMTVLLPFAYYQWVLLPMLENARKRPSADKDDLLIGMEGRATRDIDPVGTVHVNSESWTATSAENIRKGTTVVVIGREGLRLIVEGIKEKRRAEFPVEDAVE